MENNPTITDTLLRAFLEESLPPAQMAAIEQALREDASLHARLTQVRGEQDAGMHSLGAIWRRHRLSCPDRNELSQYLLGVLDEEVEHYLQFHLDRIGCRFCSANLLDLQRQREESQAETQQRRHRFMQTSAGYLRR